MCVSVRERLCIYKFIIYTYRVLLLLRERRVGSSRVASSTFVRFSCRPVFTVRLCYAGAVIIVRPGCTVSPANPSCFVSLATEGSPTAVRRVSRLWSAADVVGSTEVLYLTRSCRLDSPEPVWSRTVDVSERRPCPQRRSFFFFFLP